MKSGSSFTPYSNHFGLRFLYMGAWYFTQPDQIIRLEAVSNYTCIYFNNHRPILMAKVLHEYQSLLEPFGFIRTHRSHLINRQHVTAVDENHLVMADKSNAGISRRKRKEVMSVFKDLL